MTHVRTATLDDAEAVAAIYAPVVRDTFISFEEQAPTTVEMRCRIADKLKSLPWFVSVDDRDQVSGYAYASKLRDRAAYQWSVETTVYVRSDSQGRGVGRLLYERLFAELGQLGYVQAFAGIALPNQASVKLHESVGFKPLGVYRKVGYKHGAWHDVAWWQMTLREPSDAPEPPRAFGL